MKLGSISSLPPADRTGRIIALGITVAVPLALWFGLGAPLIGWHAQRAASLSQRRELLRHMEELVGNIPELQRQAAQAQSDDRADSLLAGDSDAIAAAGVQEKVQAIAAAAGATISSAEMLPSQELGDYRRIALRVSVYAHAWPDLARLLQGMTQTPPKMLIGELEIRAMPSRDASSDTPISATITILAYRAATHEH